MRNIFDNIPIEVPDEIFEGLVQAENVCIQRIISDGQATDPGEWLSQEKEEWVILLKGGAEVIFEDDPRRRVMRPGDYLYIEKGKRHRVESTLRGEKTVWLAVHF